MALRSVTRFANPSVRKRMSTPSGQTSTRSASITGGFVFSARGEAHECRGIADTLGEGFELHCSNPSLHHTLSARFSVVMGLIMNNSPRAHSVPEACLRSPWRGCTCRKFGSSRWRRGDDAMSLPPHRYKGELTEWLAHLDAEARGRCGRGCRAYARAEGRILGARCGRR
jgi:hypothetical protein